MLKGLYQRILALAGSPKAPWWLAGVAFAESSFFPVPPDVLLLPMMLAQPRHVWRYAALCTLASVVGGVGGYFIGFAFFQQIGLPILRAYHYGDAFAQFQQAYAQWGFWIILIKGLTPIPYKLVTIASGVAGFSLWLFICASIISRGVRFFLIAALVRTMGEPVRDFIERRLALVTSALLAALLGGFLLLRYL